MASQRLMQVACHIFTYRGTSVPVAHGMLEILLLQHFMNELPIDSKY